MGCFVFLPSQSSTSYIFTLSLFDDILIILMLDKLLEMSETTAHLHSIGFKVILRSAHLQSSSFVKLNTIVGFEIRLRAALIGSLSLQISIKWFPLVIVFDHKRRILMVSKRFFELVELLLFYLPLDSLDILSQFDLQIGEF